MDILTNVVLLVVGFILLIKGADMFVDSSVNIASKLGIPAIVIGLTIVSIGTSAPELVTSLVATLQGSTDLAVGNVVGSNIFNLLFIVGVCALIVPFYMNVKTIEKDFYISIVAALALLVINFVFEDVVPRWGSGILLIGFIVYIVQLVRNALKEDIVDEELESKGVSKKPLMIGLILVVGIAMIIIGSQLIVNSAVELATMFGMSERVIGLTIVAIGTSLPELTVSLNAFKKQETGIAFGNIIGSNIFNILFILGVTGVITPLQLGGPFDLSTFDAFRHTPIFDLVFLIVVSILVLIFVKVESGLNRVLAGIMLALYVGYTVLLILN